MKKTFFFMLFFISTNTVQLYAQKNKKLTLKKNDETNKVKTVDKEKKVIETKSVPVVNSENTVTDCDGNIYHTIKIGTQVWMIENLKTTKYRDCTPIPNVKDDAAWTKLTEGGYCNYKNLEKNSGTYGRLYNWYVIEDKRGIAPQGWHVPTNDEFKTLVEFLGGESMAGGKMKEAGFVHWPSPNKDATNSSGFTGLPGGNRGSESGSFYVLGQYGYLWTSTESEKNRAFNRHLLLYSGAFEDNYKDVKCAGFSIRCIKD
jgi:uncharacterized protein (TIGR02145 family)